MVLNNIFQFVEKKQIVSNSYHKVLNLNKSVLICKSPIMLYMFKKKNESKLTKIRRNENSFLSVTSSSETQVGRGG